MTGKRIVIRGLFLPGGMDELDDVIDAEYTAWFPARFRVTPRLIREFKAGTLPTPVDIIGHSLGANAALTMANALGAAGVPVGLVVMLDPTVRAKLKHGRGYAFQSKDRRAKEIDGATNYSRPDLNHMSMTEDAKIIAFIKEHLSEPIPAKKPAGKPEPDKSAMAVPLPDEKPIAVPSAIPVAPPNTVTIPAVKRPINELIWHCAATPEGKDYTVADIRAWHRARGWSDVGYHFIVYRDGRILPGRPLGDVGAHVSGHNTGTIGACYIGGVSADGKTPKDTRTPAQRESMLWLTTELAMRYPAIKRISGHNEHTNAKACPSFNVPSDALGSIPGFKKGKRV